MDTHLDITERDRLTWVQRPLELFTDVAMMGLLGFLVYHQQTNSGFYTEQFSQLAMFCLYGPILLSLAAPAIRAWTGHRNPARPFEIATHLFLALGSLWLLMNFPFNFAHLADTLPAGLHFALAWVTDDIGRILLLLQVIIGPIAALLTGLRYFAFRHTLTHAY